MNYSDAVILPPHGKQKRAYAQADTLREAAEILLRGEDELSPRIDEEDLWRPEGAGRA